MAEPEKPAAAVYVSWKTFLNSIEALSKAVIPNVIDKKVFTGMAFSVQNQLFSGMRFLGLIDEKNKPTPELEELAQPSEEERKKKLRQILQGRYADLFALNLKKTTPDELEKKMAECYGVGGDTREKAVRFFVSAAEYVGIELSPYVAKKGNGSASRGSTTRKRSARKQPPINSSGNSSSGTSKTVGLRSGGTLTLSATLDLFALNAEDRKFVFELRDKLDEYERITAPSGNSEAQ